jgi:hemerythrin-like domain-containing protein
VGLCRRAIDKETSMTAVPVASMWPSSRDAREDGFVVLDACHRRMLAAVGALEELVAAIERGYPSDADRAHASSIAEFFSTTARRHHEDEERHVFPALLAGTDEAGRDAALRLQQDHGWIEEDWLELEPHVQAIATGYGHCDADVLRQGVAVFAALLREHIALEESLAYPQARSQLGAAGRRTMGREMAARRSAERAARRY